MSLSVYKPPGKFHSISYKTAFMMLLHCLRPREYIFYSATIVLRSKKLDFVLSKSNVTQETGKHLVRTFTSMCRGVVSKEDVENEWKLGREDEIGRCHDGSDERPVSDLGFGDEDPDLSSSFSMPNDDNDDDICDAYPQ